MPIAAVEEQDEEYMNTLRLEIPYDSVVIESVSGIDLMSNIVYSEEQHVPSPLRIFSSGNRFLILHNGTCQIATLSFLTPVKLLTVSSDGCLFRRRRGRKDGVLQHYGVTGLGALCRADAAEVSPLFLPPGHQCAAPTTPAANCHGGMRMTLNLGSNYIPNIVNMCNPEVWRLSSIKILPMSRFCEVDKEGAAQVIIEFFVDIGILKECGGHLPLCPNACNRVIFVFG